METIKIAIAEDQALFRAGILALLANSPNIEPIFEAENGKELIEKIEIQAPDVILLDLEMPVMDGMEAAKHIREHFPDIKILVLSNHDEDSFIIHMIELGANGYLLKDADPAEMEEAIEVVVANNYYFNDHISNAMLKRLMNNQKINPTFNQQIDLNDREIDTLKYLCAEFTSQEIGDKLFVSKRTVEGYRQSLMDKTGAKNVAGLVMFAIKNGFVDV